MKLTKYMHACVTLEKEGKRLIIDPGSFDDEYGGDDNVAAVVVTHVHPDHFSKAHLEAIVAANPDVPIFTTQEVAEQYTQGQIIVPKAGDEHTAGPFTLRFYGGEHAIVHPSFPHNQNIGVDVDDGTIYYPGDSFTLPNREVNVLLTPASGPWLKTAETIDFLDTVTPKVAVPTHNAILSELGSQLTEKWLSATCEKHGITYTHLEPGQSIDT